MKVDAAGQPVVAGTFGLYEGMSARVLRTFVDPIKDDEEAQTIIADGGYVVDCGSHGENVTYPSSFTATYDGDTVKAQDGTVVGVGDTVEVLDPPSTKKPLTVRSLYPIGTLQGVTCCSLNESEGGAPDGHWSVSWGQIVRVVAKAKAGAATATKTPTKGTIADGPWETPAGLVHKGDTVRIVKGDADYNGIVQGGRLSGKDKILDTKITEVTRGSKSIGTVEGYYPSRVTEIFKSDSWLNIDPKALERGDWIRFIDDGGKETSGTVVATTTDTGRNQVQIEFDADQPLRKVFQDEAYWVTRAILEVKRGASAPGADMGQDMEQEQTVAKREPKFGKVDIVREGTQIILAAGMSTRTAIAELTRQAEQDEMDVAVMELIPGFPLDAAHAFVKTLEKKYGWVNALPTPGFFGPQPPVMIGIQVDPDGRTVQIPWGQLGIPGISGKLTTGIQFVDNKPVFCIGGTIKQKDKGVVSDIAQLTREYLKAGGSIYKAKAIRIQFPSDPKKFSPMDNQPKFIPTADVRPEELIFSADVEKRVRVNIWTPIQSLAAVKAARVPLKRGVLLHGIYGVGKTLLASVTARLAVQAGITFIDLVDSRQLPQGIAFARELGGMVVIFAEDIDRCDESGTRSDAFNEILNTVDGLTSKTDEVLIVYTTNHIERISKAMLRQGRIDKVIHIKAPDAEAAERLVRLYARHMLPADENLKEVGRLLEGFIPSAIREVVEQSKLAAIERGDVHHITAEDLRVTAEDTLEHNALLVEPPKDDRSDLEKLGDAVGTRIGAAFIKAWDGEDEEELGAAGERLLRSMTRRKAA